MFIIPFSIFIKLITRFGYLYLKVSSKIITKIIDLNNFDNSSFFEIYDNLFIELYCYYYNFLLKEVLDYKIYIFENKIILSPNFLEKLFKNVKSLKKAVLCANNIIKLRFTQT